MYTVKNGGKCLISISLCHTAKSSNRLALNCYDTFVLKGAAVGVLREFWEEKASSNHNFQVSSWLTLINHQLS